MILIRRDYAGAEIRILKLSQVKLHAPTDQPGCDLPETLSTWSSQENLASLQKSNDALVPLHRHTGICEPSKASQRPRIRTLYPGELTLDLKTCGAFLSCTGEDDAKRAC